MKGFNAHFARTASWYLHVLLFLCVVPALADHDGDASGSVPWQDYYVWVKWVGIATAFVTAYGIGANDVANNMGVCVGSKSLTMFQAIVLAGICEFIGSTLLGSQVVDTIKKGVTQTSAFPRPEILLMGMFCALIGAMLWLLIATRAGMPVSTTHSIVGGILGMAMAAGGLDAINWPQTWLIIGTWLVSPIVSGVVGVAMFWATRKYIFRKDPETALRRSWIMFPFYTFLMMVVVWVYLLLKGSPRLDITESLGSWVPVGERDPAATPPTLGKPGMLAEPTCEQPIGTAVEPLATPSPGPWTAQSCTATDANGTFKPATAGWDGKVFTGADGVMWEWAPGVGLAALVAIGIAGVLTVIFYYSYRGRLARQIAAIGDAEELESKNPNADTHGVLLEMPPVQVPETLDGRAALMENSLDPAASGSVRLPAVPGDESNNDSTESLAAETENSPEHTPESSPSKADKSPTGSDVLPVKKSSSFSLKALKKRVSSLGSAGKDVHGHLSEKAQSLHDNAEKFPPKVEKMFDSLLVIAAIFASIAHGANDVANSIGPLAAMIGIDDCRCLSSENEVPFWILALGGGGIVIGVATYGHKVIRTVGVKLCMITPSRGFFIMFSKGVTVIIASRIGIPLSSTHCLVGATIAIGVLEDPKKGVNWGLFGKIMLSWLLTILFAAICSAALFSMMIYSPQIVVNH